MITQPWFWIFNAVVVVLLAVDLLVLQRRAHEVKAGEAALLVGFWIALSLGFAGWIASTRGPADAGTFLFGYAIEYLLSVDNIFVFVLIFTHFKVPAVSHHRVLFWGILGAILLRGTMIALGVEILDRFHWMIHVFGGFLVYTGLRMVFGREEPVDPANSRLLRICRRVLPLSDDYHGARFTIRENGRLLLTPLVPVLIIVETTDLVFAVDSIPAVFGITTDPFLVYTSNICAILGLRSLYFLLARMVTSFAFLKIGLAAVLTFIGVKMMLSELWEIPRGISMLVVCVILGASVALSVAARRRAQASAAPSGGNADGA